ncbi:MAG: site-specific integrase [Desulfovibrio sp.]|nr:site-specific integrase [Desulfovibrio sp.]
MDTMLPAPAGSAGTVQEAGFGSGLLDRFISFLDVAPRSVGTYTQALRRMLGYFSGKGVSRPRREDLIEYRDALKAEGKKASTISLYMVAARLFFRWLAQENLYPDVAEHIKGAKIDKVHKRDYLTASQIRTVLDGIDRSTPLGVRDYALIALMASCGLRTIEVSRADVGDLGTAGGASVLYVQGKGRSEKAEYVKLPEPVERAVRVYLASRGKVGEKDPLFASLSRNCRGERLSTRSISGAVKERMVEAGYSSPRLTAHSLRHSAVTLSLLAGRSLEEVQQFARHSNVATTLIYSHAVDAQNNACAGAVADAIFKDS